MSFSILPSDRFSIKPPNDVRKQDESKSLRGRCISVQFQMAKTVENAAAIAASLNLLKERLLIEFGQSSHSFIAKTIDPMVLHVKKIVEELTARQQLKLDSIEGEDALKKAIDSVSLYTQFSDEKKLRKKIVHETVQAVRRAIEKDCEILKNYELYFLQNEVVLTQDRDQIEELLKRKLEAIFHEFAKLQQQEYQDDDLRKLFLWKSQIDMQRGALTELGLFTVDSILHHSTQIPTDTEEPTVISQQKIMVEELVDKAQILLHLAESGAHFDLVVFKEMDQLLVELKGQARRIEPTVAEEFQDVFESVQDTICQLDILMLKKRH